MIFDGRAFAKEIEERVKVQVSLMKAKPKIVSVLIGDDPASALYTRLKSEAAQRVGIAYAVERVAGGQSPHDLSGIVRRLSELYDGVMVQMPIPGLSRDEQQEVIRAIPLDKDVDGLCWEESGTMPATVKAILSLLERIAEMPSSDHSLMQGSELWGKKFVIIGTHGSVGKPLVHFLRERGVKDITEVNSKETDPARSLLVGEVVISCVGKAGLVTKEMVQEGAIVIDVGISKVDGKTVGDMTQEVYQKASIAVPVPGGVGPVTVASLLENALSTHRV